MADFLAPSKPVLTEGRKEDGEDGPPPLKYQEPEWGALPQYDFYLEVLKNGTILETIPLTGKTFFVVGRLPTCDLSLEHPSISRHHAIIQHSDNGKVYVYDLGSTHGTKINKTQVEARKFFQLHVGQMVRFGASSRLHILQCDGAPRQEEELELVQEEMKFREAKAKFEQKKAVEQNTGVSWGMDDDEDQVKQEDLSSASDADILASIAAGKLDGMDSNSGGLSFYEEDPKKALKAYFDREGAHLDYDMEEEGQGKARLHVCRVIVPVELGNTISIEGKGGNKKEAVAQCALLCCRFLDRKGILRGGGVRASRKHAPQEDDDDANDTFYDRTGDVEKRLAKKGKDKTETVFTYEDLCSQHDSLGKELETATHQLSSLIDKLKKKPTDDDSTEGDALDSFMSDLASTGGLFVDRAAKRKLENRVKELKTELLRVSKLKELCKPTLPSVVVPPSKSSFSAPPIPNERSALHPAIGDQNEKFLVKLPVSEIAEPHHLVPDPQGHRQELPHTVSSSISPSLAQKSPLVRERPSDDPKPSNNQPQKHAAGEKDDDDDDEDLDLADDATAGIILRKRRSRAKKRKLMILKEPGEDPEEEDSYGETSQRKPVGHDNYAPDPYDPDYTEWVPPSNQSGDGSTSLNAKFGY